MRLAIQKAQEAEEAKKGRPFGAVIVKDGKVIVAVHNSVIIDNDSTCHAEVNAIRKASKLLNSPDLTGCTLYSTCEPCPMCFTACWWAKVSKLVFGATLEDASNGGREILLKARDLNQKGGSIIEIKEEFLREECLPLYK